MWWALGHKADLPKAGCGVKQLLAERHSYCSICSSVWPCCAWLGLPEHPRWLQTAGTDPCVMLPSGWACVGAGCDGNHLVEEPCGHPGILGQEERLEIPLGAAALGWGWRHSRCRPPRTCRVRKGAGLGPSNAV